MDPVSAGASLVSGILGYASQRQANKTNLQIARETNALNAQLQREVNQQNLDIFNRQLEYNSPAEQRRMLEEAGYNPASYTDKGSSSPSPSAPNMVAPHMERAEVSPYLGFAQDAANMASVFKITSEAEKAKQEADYQKKQNAVFDEMMRYEFESRGLANKWQELQNRFAGDTYEDRARKILNEADKELELKNELHMKNALLELYGEREYKAKINQLEEQAKLWKQQGKTEITKQDLNEKLGQKAVSDAQLNAIQGWYLKYKAPSEVAKNEAEANASAWQGTLTQKQWSLLDEFGRSEKAAAIFKDLKAADFSEAATEKAFEELKKIKKDIDWYEFQQLCTGVKAATSALSPAGLLLLGM